MAARTLHRPLAIDGWIVVFPWAVSPDRYSTRRRWLLIQVHRAQIARLQRSARRDQGSEIAERMNAIALLCDRGRTERGRQLAARLAQSERAAAAPVLTGLSLSEPLELPGRVASAAYRR